MTDNVFFTSDTHFGHHRILELGAGRHQFEDIEVMDQTIIDRWNAIVAKGDRIYHLGDFSFHSSKRTTDILTELKGQIHFVRGNHDDVLGKILKNPNTPRRITISDYKEIRIDGQKLCMFHFPILSWHNVHKGSWHLHGHCHGNLQYHNGPMLDVGVDCHDYTPWSWEEVREKLKDEVWESIDHHDPNKPNEGAYGSN